MIWLRAHAWEAVARLMKPFANTGFSADVPIGGRGIGICRLFMCFLFILAGCAAKQAVSSYPDHLPITEQAKELTKLPAYRAPLKEGEVLPIGVGEQSPVNGVVMTEDKAFAAAELRVAYDEIYGLANSNTKYLTSIVMIQEKELYRADSVIAAREKELDEIRNSWWDRNKVWVGIGIGIVGGVGLSLGAATAWAEIDERTGAR